eukprot:4317621-Amphidinium_carterae.1
MLAPLTAVTGTSQEPALLSNLSATSMSTSRAAKAQSNEQGASMELRGLVSILKAFLLSAQFNR